MHAKHRRRDDTSVHGWHRVRENDEAQTQNANIAVFEARDCVPKRWATLFNVQSWRYAKESYNRGQYSSAVDPAEDHEGRRDSLSIPDRVDR